MDKKERKELYAGLQHMLSDDDTNITRIGDDCKIENMGEGMKLLFVSVDDWWKPIVLFDCKDKTASVFIDPEDLTLQNVKDSDIDWKSLRGLDPDILERVKNRIAYFPTNIRGFHNGTAEVEWDIVPDGMYYMDEDGFGMTNDVEVKLLGRINRAGDIVKKFTLCR